MTTGTKVELHEDNAGHLFLHAVGSAYVWGDFEAACGDFETNAAALAYGDIDDWTLPSYTLSGADGENMLDTIPLIAIYDPEDQTSEIVGRPGSAAQYFLGLSDEELEELQS